MIRSYSELIKLPTFEERFKYLALDGRVGSDTFGHKRYLNQSFYLSKEWKNAKAEVIIRDNGCDLGVPGYDISEFDKIIVHHMNPVTIEQVRRMDPILFDPEYLITTRFMTHESIHYNSKNILNSKPVVRSKNDTAPWLQ